MSDPTFGPAYEIDQAAKRLLAEVMSSNWVLRERLPDYFVDYEIERRQSGEPTAQVAWVQMKGQAKLNCDGGAAKLSFKTKHLRYYNDARLPVFVVLVDTTNKRAYYLFIQEWLQAQRLKIEGQKTLTISVPLHNSLENYPKFLADFERALGFMQDRFPGRPEAALSLLEKEYERLDERFSVRATGTSSSRHFEIIAKQPAELNFHLDGLTPEKMAALSDAFNWGKSLKLTDVKVSVEGSRLFDKVFDSPPSQFQWQAADELKGSCSLIAKSGDHVGMLNLPVTVSRGLKGAAIRTTAAACPLQVELLLHTTNSGGRNTAQFILQINPGVWVGLDLLGAPFRKPVTDFVRAIKGTKTISISVTTDRGQYETQVPAVDNLRRDMEGAFWWFGLIDRVAELVSKCDAKPQIPDPEQITDECLQALRHANETLTKETIRRPWMDIMPPPPRSAGVEKLVRDVSSLGQIQGRFKGAFPCWVEILGTHSFVGMHHVPEQECRLSLSPEPSPDHPATLRLEPISKDGLLLVFQPHPAGSPAPSEDDGAFNFDSSGP